MATLRSLIGLALIGSGAPNLPSAATGSASSMLTAGGAAMVAAGVAVVAGRAERL